MIEFSRRAAAAAVAVALLAMPALADEWPSRQVTILVPTGAGGNTDLMARMAAEQLAQKFGQPFVVENRPSAGGALASGQVATSAPDGYTLMFTPDSMILLTPLVQKLNFDPDERLQPVTNVGTGSQVIAVKRSLPVNNLAEFIAYAKANPGKLNFAVAGTNNISHLAPVLLFKMTGVNLVMVPSRSEPQAISDLIAGNVDFYFGNASVLLQQKDHPKIKILAVGTAQRIGAAPDLPAAAETVPGFVFASWNGFMAPRDTPEPVVAKLRNALIDIIKSPAMSQKLAGLGIEPGGQTKEQVDAVFAKDRESFAAAVKAAGIPKPQ